MSLMTENIEGLKIFMQYAFGIEMNCNDFFNYATAHTLQVEPANFEWILPIAQKYKDDGVNACLAYIANIEPLQPYRTENYDLAISEIKAVNPRVYGDVDYLYNGYNPDGPYRTLSKID